MSKFYATGKRKTAIAKVWLEQGSGELSINEQDIKTWLLGKILIQKRLLSPLVVSKTVKTVNIRASVSGGGFSAQADAVRHGISKALVSYDENLRVVLKPFGYLTRDSRKVERKKFGRRKARKMGQFSKR
jgi:small subunit ribosomal protein S9